MALRIRFQYPTANKLGYSIEQLISGYVYDFNLTVFVPFAKTTVANMILPLPEMGAPFIGSYDYNMNNTPNFVFQDTDYVVKIHDTANNNLVLANLCATMRDGDDMTR